MRNIIWGQEFTRQVERAGGARIIDDALSPILDGLSRDPYGFPKEENDFTSFRYARTKEVPGVIGPLIIVFALDANKDVMLEWYEEI